MPKVPKIVLAAAGETLTVIGARAVSAMKSREGQAAAAAARGAYKAATSEEGRQWLRDHAPKSAGRTLADRIAATVARTTAMVERPGPPKERERNVAWRKRAVALDDRLSIPVAKDKKKAHLKAIEDDLDALLEEMNSSLS